MHDQRQRTGNQSVAIQAGNNIIINQGLTNNEASEIFQKLFDREIERLERTAQAVAVGRLEQLRTELDSRLKQLESSKLSAFADPDVQMLISDSQRGYIRSGSEYHLKTLADLVATRCSVPDQGFQAGAIRSAVEVVPRLPMQAIAAITAVWIIRYVKHRRFWSHQALQDWADEVLNKIIDDIPTDNKHYDYIVSANCAFYGASALTVGYILRVTYPGLFQSGFDINELDEGLRNLTDNSTRSAELFMPCLNNDSKLQVAALDEEAAEQLIRSQTSEEDLVERYKLLIRSKVMSNAEIESLVSETHPAWEKLIHTWNNSGLKNLSLNSTGYAIAHSYYTNGLGQEADLSKWIPG